MKKASTRADAAPEFIPVDEPSVTLFGAAYSVYTRIVRLALAEKGVSYRLEPVDIFAKEGVPEPYLARHPFGRIPAFEHGDLRLYEAGAITRYVDEAFPGPALQPEGAEPRARMNQMISLLDAYGFRALVWEVFFERVRVPQQGGACDEARISTGLETCRTCLATLERIRGRSRWLAGPEISLADLHAYPMMVLFALAHDGAKLLGDFPKLIDWQQRIAERDSAKATWHPLETQESE